MKISRLFRRILMLLAVLFFFGINAFNVSPALAADYDLTQIYFLCDTNGTIADFSDGTAAMLNRMLADISDFDCSDIKTPIKCDGNTVSSWSFGNDTGILEENLCDYIKGTMKAEYGYSLYAEEIATETCSAGQMLVDGACVEPEFTITTTEMVANDVFSFKLSAKGKYFIDWGDGESKPINKTTVSSETISHTYSEDGVYKIRFIGDATAYPSKKVVVSFKDNLYIKELHGSLGAIFGGSNAYMFNGTFEGCTNLSLISETLFNGVTESADSMFNSTFQGCSSLKAIPGGLFDILNGAEYQASQQMFMETFRDCTALTEIPGDLFSKVTGGATGLFEATFRGCVSLTTIYADLFNHFSVSADNMFGGTFWGCPSLSSIPSGLFDNITAGANSLFYSTFRETAVTEVPSGLFANITTGAMSLFDRTFYGCFNLTTIPDNLFAGITSTENAESMFNSTFYGCTLLNTLPENLFSNIQGDTPPDMFRQTFKGCKGFVDTYIPKNFFAGLTLPVDVSAADVMDEIFSGTSLLQKCPAGTYKYTTEFSSAWSGKVSCTETCPSDMTAIDGVCTKVDCAENQMIIDGACVEPEFTITTTNMAAESTFSFKISASGVFYVDFDDGRGVQKIDRTNNTTNTKYTSAAYANAGTHIIKMYGDATRYTSSYYVAAISFTENTNIKSVGGSLGAIFGDSAEYMFAYTFGGCTSLQEIPATLFSGVTGSADAMFDDTFFGCTSLQSIPENLFAGVTGSADEMFNGTFYGCTSLQSIPENLFAGVTGSADAMFNGTFYSCISLQSIPENLFAGVTGSAYGMFGYTFYGCTSLRSIPENLFAGVTGSADAMFNGTFSGCTSLQLIPENLFAGVTGSADEMFNGTFSGCTSLQSIPENLFAGVTGSAYGIFGYTFYGCTSLQSIPENLFAGVTGSADEMFNGTFSDCTSLQSLPSGLFKNITGKPAFGAFAYAFYGCTNLTGYIPYDMFAGLEYASGAMIEIFNNTALDTICPAGTYQYITGFESDWSGKVSCAECPDGTTSAAGASDISQCVGGRTLHIGDDITMNLTTTRPTTPRVMVFQVLNELYYGGLSDTEKTINKNTDKKFRIFFDNKDYWLHDYTVE